MIFRRAVAGDSETVSRLLSQVLEVHVKIRPDVFVPGSIKYKPEDFAAMFADDNAPVYVAEEDGEVLGYAFCRIRVRESGGHMIPGRSLFIDDLCVDEKSRGLGVGEAIFAFVRDEARRLGCSDITLMVWEGNDPAVSFYRKMGMTPRETVMEYKL